MNESTSPVSPVTIPALPNLRELRSLHSSFLQRQERQSRDLRPSPGEILGFLDAARALGRRLSDFDQRETAQGIMDYWTSRLISQAPMASDDLSSFYLDDFDESSVGTTEDSAWSSATAIAKGDALCRSLTPPERAIFRRLLFRFVQLKERSTEFYPVPLSASDSLLEEPGVQALVRQMIQAGLVREMKAGDKTIAFQLVSGRLIFDWAAVVKLAVQRRGFRELAHGWDKGGRPSAALLDGGQALANAADFVDLDKIETAFIDQSRRKKDLKWRVAALALIALIVFLSMSYMQVKAERDEFARVSNERKQAMDKLAQNVIELKEERATALANLASAKAALRTAEALLEAARPLVQNPENVRPVENPEAVKYNAKMWHDANESLEVVRRDITTQSRKPLKK